MAQEWRFSNDSCGVAHEGDQIWLFDDKAAVTGVKVLAADGKELVEFGAALEDLEVLGAQVSPQNGSPIPGKFTSCPYSGVKPHAMLRASEALSSPDWDGDGLPMHKFGTGELKLANSDRQSHRMPSGNVLCVVAGRPAALYALDYSQPRLFRYSPSKSAWLTDHPDPVPRPQASGRKMWADAIVATSDGIAYAGREGPVWINLPILGEASVTIQKDCRCVGAPALVQASKGRQPRGNAGRRPIYCPVIKDGKLNLAGKVPGTKDWHLFPVKVEGELPDEIEFAPPVVSFSANFWIGKDGLLILPVGENTATFRPWPTGIKAVPQSRPFVDSSDTMWMLGQATGDKYVFVQLEAEGFGDVQELDGPYFSAGDRCYRSLHMYTLGKFGRPQVASGPEIQRLVGFEDSFFLPMQTFHPINQPTDGSPEIAITLGALVSDVVARRDFLEGASAHEHRVRMMLHPPGNPAIDLEAAFTATSVASIATYRYNDRLYVHSRESDKCYSWPVSFS